MLLSTKSIRFNFDEFKYIKLVKALFDILSSVIYGTTNIDIKKLPTQGFFYPKDFEIKLKKAKIEDIIDYEYNFKPDNILEIIEIIKKVVRKNI